MESLWLLIVVAFVVLAYWQYGDGFKTSFNKPDLRVSYDNRSEITVVNPHQREIVVHGLAVNGSKLPACSVSNTRRLSEGQSFTFWSLGLAMGNCGRIVRVTVRTDEGERDYHFD